MIVPNFRGASPVDRHHSSLAKPPRFARRLVYYREAASAVFESPFIDFQGFDPVLKSRGRYPKLDRGSRWSGNPTSALSQHGLDNLPLAARLCLTLESYRRCNPRCRQRGLFGKPQLVNGKNVTGAQNHGPLNYVLQLANVAWPVVGLQQAQRLFVNRADILPRREAYRCTQYSTSIRMSSFRSRRGGTSMGNTLSR